MLRKVNLIAISNANFPVFTRFICGSIVLSFQDMTREEGTGGASVPITLLLYNGSLLCGYSVPIKGLIGKCTCMGFSLVCSAFSGRSRPPMTPVFSAIRSFLYMFIFHVAALHPVYHRITLSPTSSCPFHSAF